MNLLNRLLRAAPSPGVAVEVAANYVSAASVDLGSRGTTVTAHAIEPLPEGALVPALVAQNVRDAAAVGSALARVLERVGRPKRVALVVPDPVAKVSLARLERTPERAGDLDRLIRFQMRKSAPFSMDDAQVSWVPVAQSDGAREFVVTLAKRDVIQEYETLCARAGAHAGIVDLATFNIANAVLAGRKAPLADWLLVHTAAGYASIAVLRDSRLLFFRSRGTDADDSLTDLVHQTVMYYEDRLQGAGLGRVFVSESGLGEGAPSARENSRRGLETRLNVPVETVDLRGVAALADRIASAPVLDSLAPLVGLLLRGKEAA
jgi:Tfp pilus assembly PilM family ATPase